MAVGYNPADRLQAAFLRVLRLGETGNAANASTVGYGGTDLAGTIASGNVDQYGFPIWTGLGNSHAAGMYQFQPGTWDAVASEHHLIFSHPEDQSAAAWYYAQQVDPSISAELAAGDYSSIQRKLQSVWPSVTGNAANPAGLANELASLLANDNAPSGNYYDDSGVAHITIGGSKSDASSSGTSPSGGTVGGKDGTDFQWFNPASWQSFASDFFTRGALIFIGAVIILVALWMLLSNQAKGLANG